MRNRELRQHEDNTDTGGSLLQVVIAEDAGEDTGDSLIQVG